MRLFGTEYASFARGSKAARQGPRFEIDPGGKLSDLTKLFSYWPLGEVGGDRLDRLGRVHLINNSALIVVGAGPSSDGGDMTVLDVASGQYLKRADDIDVEYLSGTTSWTLSAWVKADTTSDGAGHCIVGRLNTNVRGFLLGVIGVGTTAVKAWGNVTNSAGTAGDAITSVTVATGSWLHAMAAYDGTNVFAWINGGNEASAAGPSGGADSANLELRIGRTPSTGTPYQHDGKIAHVAMWRGVAFGANEAALLYNNGTPNRLRSAA